ncbi:MAG: flagellar filament capping protein FliD [Candidatus Marinimicrobia bacterium]|nr:flagellar filament capping protein FliD [Candidatus Neomarinimicrobiota bacterium]
MAEAGGTSSVSGLFSGIDFRDTIEKIIAVEGISADLLQLQIDEQRQKLTAWREFNTKLLALKSAGDALNADTDFKTFKTNSTSSSSTDVEDLISVSTSADAQPGNYTIEIQSRAEARKLSSAAFSSDSTALSLTGEFLINGVAVSIASTDTLLDIRDAINNLNSGSDATKVTATILTVTVDSDYRLILTSDETGADKFDLLDASSTNILQSGGFDFITGTMSIKNSVSPDDAASDYFTSSTATVDALTGLSSAPSGTIQINGSDVVLDLSTMSITDVKTAIDNASIANISTTITTTEDDDGKTIYRLEIVDSTGAPTFTDSGNVLQALGILESAVTSELNAESDSTIVIDGITINRDDNIIDDVIEGTTLNLLQAETGTNIEVNVERNLDSVISKMTDLVKAYNVVVQFVKQQLQLDEEQVDEDSNVIPGILSGDSGITSARSVARSAATDSITGLPDDYNSLSKIGITVNAKGKLELDEDDVRAALRADFAATMRVFIAEETATDSDVEFINHTEDTTEGEYTVNITQAATQTTITGTVDLSANPLTADETFTITDSGTGRVATVSLSNGDDIDTIINTINSSLSSETIETHIGSFRITTDGSTAITSTTLWSEINLGTAISNNDTIAVTGTNAAGVTIEDSFLIDDITTGTVQDFLSFIEGAFDKEMNVTLDDGYIVFKDIKGRDSSFSITIAESAGSLDFGTVDATNNSTNESGTEGRYKIEMAASKDGSNNLVLTHDNYGDVFDFTVTTSATLGIEDTNVTIGKDVAGTIGGESATGDGQVLIGDTDNSNTDSLVILYTGTTTGDQGTVKLTLGVGELINRQLGFITDSLDGFVTLRQEAIEDRIDTLDDRIFVIRERLDRKKTFLLNKFVAMEAALAELSSRSIALTAQLRGLQSLLG